MIRPSLKTNIYNLYLIKLSKWLMLIMPIVALYYTENGLSNFDIYLLQAIYSFSVALMEIPSGYMADVIGRKKSLVIGAVLGTLGFLIYSLSSGLYGFILAEIVLGLGGSFVSGSDSALLYDTLASQKKEQTYLRYEGRITALGNFAETVAALCGGLIAALASYRGVYICQTVIAFVAIPASLLLIEPERVKKLTRPSFKQIVSICHTALFVNKKLSAAILMSAVIGTSTLCMAWTSQVYFVYNGLDEVSITPIWVALNLTVAVVSAFAYKVKDTVGYKNALLLIIFYIPCGYILLGALPLVAGLFALLIFYGVRGVATPMLRDITNHQCSSEIRATVFSIRSLIIRISFSLLGPAIGLITQKLTLGHALIIAGAVLLLLTLITGRFFFKHLPEIISPPQKE